MFDRSAPAVIFKPGRFPLHHGTLGIIRSLGSAGVPVYAVLEDSLVPAGLSRYLTGRVVWTPDENSDDQLLAGLAMIADRIGRPAVLIPTSDHAAIFFDDHAAELTPWGLFPQPKPGLIRALADKQELHRICRSVGLDCPQSFFPKSAEEAGALVGQVEFPVLVKITEPWRRPRPAGLASTAIVRNAGELIALYRLADAAPDVQLMVQEYVPSTSNTDDMFAAYCDAESRCLVSLTGEKLRSYPADAGMTSASRSTDNEELRVLLERFLARIGYRGIVDLELRRDLRDGRYKLLDFNPRVGAQFRLYRSGAGIDVVQAMHLHLTGREVPQAAAFKRRSFVVENYELAVLWSYRRKHKLRMRDWIATLTGERELAWFSRHDKLPFLMMCVRMAYTMLRNRLLPAKARSRSGGPTFHAGRGASLLSAG